MRGAVRHAGAWLSIVAFAVYKHSVAGMIPAVGWSGDGGNAVTRSWRYAICNELFEGWSLSAIAEYAGSLGYQGLELAPYSLCDSVRDLSAADRRRIRNDVESQGLSVVGLHWLLARTKGLHLNDRDDAVRARTTQYLLDEIDLCADLGGEVLVFGSPQQRNPGPGCSDSDAWCWTVEAMRRCGERALDRGVTFCIEALAAPECCFICHVDEAASLVRTVDHPGFRMMVDVKAMAADERPVSDQIREVVDLVRHVHVNDPNRLGPGMGEVAFAPILLTLNDVGYDHWVSVEAFDATYGIEKIAQESMVNLIAAESEQGV